MTAYEIVLAEIRTPATYWRAHGTKVKWRFSSTLHFMRPNLTPLYGMVKA